MCGFTDKQLAKLRQPLDIGMKCRNFPADAGKLANMPFLPVSEAINSANEIFEFDWNSECLWTKKEFEIVSERSNQNKTKTWNVYEVCYKAKVRVEACGVVHVEEGACTSPAFSNRGEAYEFAILGAASNAKKRALSNWGNQFGLSLKNPFDPEGRETSERMMADTGYPEPATPPPAATTTQAAPAAAPAQKTAPAPTQAAPAPASGNGGDAGVTADEVIRMIKTFSGNHNGVRPAVVVSKGLNANAIRALSLADLLALKAAIQQEG